jgi:hypothetical protein
MAYRGIGVTVILFKKAQSRTSKGMALKDGMWINRSTDQ